MITLLTGTPGNGKTAHALDQLWFDSGTMWHDLDKYVDGVAELKCVNIEIPDIKELKSPHYVPTSQVDSDEYAVWLPENPAYAEFVQARALAKTSIELWYLWATPNSVIFIDEAQRHFRPRPAGSPVPFHVQLLEYHRHFGIHIFLATQKERLVHSNVRALCGQHIHLTDGWRGRHRYEWPEVKDSDSKTEKSLAARTDYKIPKHTFPFYKSSVQHLSVKHKKPIYAYAFLAAAVMVPVLLWMAYSHFKNRVDSALPVSAASGAPTQLGSIASQVASVSSPSAAFTEAEIQNFTPLVPGRPETAPAFKELRRVVVMPQISACLQTKQKCVCYTQQGSRITDVEDATCRQYLEQGQRFNPYRIVSENTHSPSVDRFYRGVQPQASETTQSEPQGLSMRPAAVVMARSASSRMEGVR